MDGPLSRGVVNQDRRRAAMAWNDWATNAYANTGDEDFRDFASGIATGIASLYERRIDHYNPTAEERFADEGAPIYVMDQALQVAATKRTNAEDREHWRKLLQHAPNDAWYRGHLAAGIILSGQEGYWSMPYAKGFAVKGG